MGKERSVVVEELKVIQGELKATDGQMAARLGMSRKHFNRAKNGREDLSDADLRKVVGAWPERMGPIVARQFFGDNFRQVAVAIFRESIDIIAAAEPETIKERFGVTAVTGPDPRD